MRGWKSSEGIGDEVSQPEARRTVSASPTQAADLLGRDIRELQQHAGNAAVSRLLARGGAAPAVAQRTITWAPQGAQEYQRDHDGLLRTLTAEFSHVETGIIDGLLGGIEGLKPKWSPYQAYQGIKNYLKANYPPQLKDLSGGSTNIGADEAQWYFLQNFKTFAEVVVDGSSTLTFVNTPDDMHAEDNMMAGLNTLVESKGWHEHFSDHTLLLRINNSPCQRCARRLYDWKYRDLFNEFKIEFANMYEKGPKFDAATMLLRSGGVTMQLVSVTTGLLPVVTTNTGHTFPAPDVAQRKLKDVQEAIDWGKWLGANS